MIDIVYPNRSGAAQGSAEVTLSFATDIDLIENRTFSELKVGDSASISRTLTSKDIELFAIMSGDVNPAHVDEEFAKSDMFHKIIAHGMWGGALISTGVRYPASRPRRNLSQSVAALSPASRGRRHDYRDGKGHRDGREQAPRHAGVSGRQPEWRGRDHGHRRGDRTNGKNLARTGPATRDQTAGEGTAVSQIDSADERPVPDPHRDRPPGPNGFPAGCHRGSRGRPDRPGTGGT